MHKWEDETFNIIKAKDLARLVKLLDERKTRRLETASWKTLTAKVKKWSLSNQEMTRSMARRKETSSPTRTAHPRGIEKQTSATTRKK